MFVNSPPTLNVLNA